MKRKGINKCYGLLLAFFTIFGLSLNVSSDTNALKYAYNAFPLSNDTFYVSGTYYTSSNFGVSFSSDSDVSFDSDLFNLSKSAFLLCNQVSDSGNLRPIFSNYFSNPSTYGLSINSSFNKAVYNFDGTCLGQPSTWDYDSIYAADYNLTDGSAISLVDLRQSFFDSDSSFYDSGSLKALSVSLPLDYDTFGVIESGTVLEWDFGLVQKSANNFSFIDSSDFASMDISYFTASPDSSNFSSSYRSTFGYPALSPKPSCFINRNYLFSTRSESGFEDFLGFNVHCSYTAPFDMYYVYPIIRLYSSDRILDYDFNGLYFTGTYVTTDNDSTWSGLYANPQPSGEQLSNAPGYFQLYGYPDGSSCLDGDFLCNLKNLFVFNFINPFYPIYQMFSDGSSCASIPVIASLLHSQESVICPWFDSSIRSILTPVIGLAAMMLLFGFVVRWLGARSGNFVEDSGGVDQGSLHFQNKYRRSNKK